MVLDHNPTRFWKFGCYGTENTALARVNAVQLFGKASLVISQCRAIWNGSSTVHFRCNDATAWNKLGLIVSRFALTDDRDAFN
jgi:hypothetical protein